MLDAPIEHDQYTAVGSRPDEPAKPLFEGKSGLGNLIVEESAASAILDCFDARLENWVARHGKRKPVDNHATQLLALNVDSLPERRGAEENRVRRRSELVEKLIPRHGAMEQQRIREDVFQGHVHLLHHVVTGEQAESTPLADSKDLRDVRLCGVEKTVVARIRDVFWHIQQRLLRIVEERWDDDLFGLGDSERLPHVRETFLDGEGSRSKDCRIVRFELRWQPEFQRRLSALPE